jgi:DNA polymerase-3 subunit alpha
MLEEKAAEKLQAFVRHPEWPAAESLAAEKELLGFYVTGHPLAPYKSVLEQYTLASTSKLSALPNRTVTRLGGLITAVQTGISKKSGKPYALATLEDLEGTVQLLCLNENFEKFRELLQPNTAVLVVGEVNLGDDRPKVFPQEMLRLDDAPRRYTTQVHLRLRADQLTAERLIEARDLVTAHRGKTPLFLCLMQPRGERVFVETHEQFGVLPTLAFQEAIRERFGPEAYYAKVDLSVPAKTPRRWEKRDSNGDSGG